MTRAFLSVCASAVWSFAQALPSLMVDVVGALAVCLISYGAWLHYQPLGYITCGVLLLGGVAAITWARARAARSG
jgi:hypothetical protein